MESVYLALLRTSRRLVQTLTATVTVNVDSVSPVSFHAGAFDHLVADEKYKLNLLSLVKSQLHAVSSTIPGDPIPEKGK